MGAAIAPILTLLMFGRSEGQAYCLETVLIVKGHMSAEEQKSLHHIPLYNHEIPVVMAKVIAFLFAVHGFSRDHLPTHYGAQPFQVAITADVCPCNRALFKQIQGCPTIEVFADDLLQYVASSKTTSVIH